MKIYSPDEKIQHARLDLVQNFPYFGSIFMRLNVFEDPTCKTAWTDGRSMGYNLDYLASLPNLCIIGVFVHECLHVILKHHLRKLENPDFTANHKRYNYAADYALNPIIKRTDGMDIMPTWLYDAKWDDTLVEYIFYELPEMENDPDFGEGGETMPGEVRPWPGDDDSSGNGKPTDAEIEAEKQNVDRWIKAAAFKAEGAGKMDGNIKQIISKATSSTVCWQDELQILTEDISKTDYTWTRPNRRYMQGGVYLPSMSGRKPVDMLFFVDTSGSLSNDQLGKIMGEVKEIVSQFKVRVIVVYWDTGFRDVEIFDESDVLDPGWKLDISGRGGTNFTGCWDWLIENEYDLDFQPKALVFFSDLECSQYPKDDPELPLLWCQVPDSSNSFDHCYIRHLPDYGKHVRVPVYK